MEKPNYYGILPANVRYDKELKPMEKILFTEISSLTSKEGYCYAKNSYFAELYDVHKNTVGNWINNLVKRGYLKSVIIYEKGTKNIQERRLYITTPTNEKTDTSINKKIDTCQSKNLEGINEKIDTPINEKIEDNNTSINNTSLLLNNNNNIHVKNEFSQSCEKIKNKWIKIAYEFDLSGKQLKINDKRKRAINNLLKEYSLEEMLQAMGKIRTSNFLQGNNKTGWQISFDWFTNKSNFLKVLEGNYDDKVNSEIKNNNTHANQKPGASAKTERPKVTAEGLRKYFGGSRNDNGGI
ncbi:helix-turn-helix domain-containing protein [Leptotrichia wadei]|uniref:helix-turn-helix domain-containing protein n=1 Tax=Leptotrichia wadei TaxID=157687 RepID=UPI0028E39CB6|nr:helix-turn-helix domain-containing protein [Leptotrichia wadei]